MRLAGLAILVLLALLAPSATAMSFHYCGHTGATDRACQIVRDRPTSIPLPDLPSDPDIPNTPGAPSAPAIPGVPAAPAIPSDPLPGVPTPGLPGVPTPGLPSVPAPPPIDPADGCSVVPQQLPLGLSRQELLRTFADPRAFCREST